MTERGRHPLHGTDVAVGLRLLNPLSPDKVEARLVNVSEMGLCLRIARSIPHSAHVQVTFKGFAVFGEVRYCRLARDGYYVGIDVETIMPPPCEAGGLTSILPPAARGD